MPCAEWPACAPVEEIPELSGEAADECLCVATPAADLSDESAPADAGAAPRTFEVDLLDGWAMP
jgi:hypothetical protein